MYVCKCVSVCVRARGGGGGGGGAVRKYIAESWIYLSRASKLPKPTLYTIHLYALNKTSHIQRTPCFK